MTHRIFDKTDKGREEIATRKYKVSPRLRSLLVMIDGKQSADELLKKVSGLGLTADNLAELSAGGFIQEVALPEPAAPVPDDTAAAAPVSGQSSYQAIYQFYTETIKTTIGLRGYALQLKVEKAASVDDLRELRAPYLEAVLQAKGNEVARSLRSRLDQLLQQAGTAPDSTAAGATVSR